MNYKLIFLGTSALWPLPRLGCQCPICQSKDPKDKRLRSSLLLDGSTGSPLKSSILFDVGPDFYHQTLCYHPEKIRHVFITHSHHDHILGFDDLSRVYNRKGKVTIYATDIAIKNIKRIFRTATAKMLFEVLKSGDEIKIDDLIVVPFAVNHTKNEKTLGFKISSQYSAFDPSGSAELTAEASGRGLVSSVYNKKTPTTDYSLLSTAVYISDCQDIPKSSLETIKDADILIVDGSSLPPQKFTDHWSIEEAIEKIKKWNLRASRLIFTHIGHLTGTHQELKKFASERSTKELKVEIGYDGMKIILSQNSKLKTQSHNSNVKAKY